MSGIDYDDGYVGTPGAGPSAPIRSKDLSKIETWREEMVKARRLELAQIQDQHDDLVSNRCLLNLVDLSHEGALI